MRVGILCGFVGLDSCILLLMWARVLGKSLSEKDRKWFGKFYSDSRNLSLLTFGNAKIVDFEILWRSWARILRAKSFQTGLDLTFLLKIAPTKNVLSCCSFSFTV